MGAGPEEFELRAQFPMGFGKGKDASQVVQLDAALAKSKRQEPVAMGPTLPPVRAIILRVRARMRSNGPTRGARAHTHTHGRAFVCMHTHRHANAHTEACKRTRKGTPRTCISTPIDVLAGTRGWMLTPQRICPQWDYSLTHSTTSVRLSPIAVGVPAGVAGGSRRRLGRRGSLAWRAQR
jgi:hypothetical protein